MQSAESLEIVNQLLRRINFRSDVFYRGQLCDSWALDTSGSGNVNFHMICHGACWLHLPGNPNATHLQSGDVVVFPEDAVHVISSSENRPEQFGIQQISKELAFDKLAVGTALVCGYLLIDKLVRKLLLSGLPGFIIINASNFSTNPESIRLLLELIFNEASQNRIATNAILDRLTDALLFFLVRNLIDNETQVPGLLSLICDGQLTKAIYAFSLNPGGHWTIDALAEQAHLSRSVFTERFIASCGQPPMEFIAIWRMYLARRWLEQERVSVLNVADRCGYKSVASFSKAFKRILGVGPGQVRKISFKAKT